MTFDKIEFFVDELHPEATGWYICVYDRFDGPMVDSVGPYETRGQALRMWHDDPLKPTKEPSDARQED